MLYLSEEDGKKLKSARVAAWLDYRADRRQQRITVKGQIRLEPRAKLPKGHDQPDEAPRPRGKIFKGAKRDHVVNRLAATLDEFRFSPFEYEAACRHGVRSMLCLDGIDWHRADAEAAALVGEALRRIHARRPTYEEGQREYSISPDYCSWCHSPLEDVPSIRKVSFCSEVCARSAVAARELNQHRSETRAFHAAWDVILRSRRPQRECEECGKSFRPSRMDTPNRFCSMKCNNANKVRLLSRPARTCPTCNNSFQPGSPSQRYCSPACGFAARRTIQERTCLHCGTAFRPKNNIEPGKFCSKACHYAHGHAPRFPKQCDECGTPFLAKTDFARFCSNRCGLAYRRKAKSGAA